MHNMLLVESLSKRQKSTDHSIIRESLLSIGIDSVCLVWRAQFVPNSYEKKLKTIVYTKFTRIGLVLESLDNMHNIIFLISNLITIIV